MAYTLSPSKVTVKDFVASCLKAAAAKMPVTMKEKIDVLHNAAMIYREHGSEQKILVSPQRRSSLSIDPCWSWLRIALQLFAPKMVQP